MSEHHIVEDVLIAYLLDELDPASRAEVVSHAAACATCGETIRAMEKAIAGYSESALPDPPARVLMQLLEAQGEHRRPSRIRPWWRSPIPAAAAVFVQTAIFLTGFWVGHQSAPTSRTVGIDGEGVREGSLPPAPQVAFQTTPPMDVWFTSGDTAIAAWLIPRDDVGDSL
jgi:anti-sigma factor RsiW